MFHLIRQGIDLRGYRLPQVCEVKNLDVIRNPWNQEMILGEAEAFCDRWSLEDLTDEDLIEMILFPLYFVPDYFPHVITSDYDRFAFVIRHAAHLALRLRESDDLDEGAFDALELWEYGTTRALASERRDRVKRATCTKMGWSMVHERRANARLRLHHSWKKSRSEPQQWNFRTEIMAKAARTVLVKDENGDASNVREHTLMQDGHYKLGRAPLLETQMWQEQSRSEDAWQLEGCELVPDANDSEREYHEREYRQRLREHEMSLCFRLSPNKRRLYSDGFCDDPEW